MLVLIVESLFAGALYFNVIKAESSAAKQYNILRASQSLSKLSDLLLRHRRVVDAGRHTPRDESSINAQRKSASRVSNELHVFVARGKKAGLDSNSIKKLRDCVVSVVSSSDNMFRDGITDGDSLKAYQQYLAKSTALYELAMIENQSTRQLLADQLTDDGANGVPDTLVPPEQLLRIGLAVNLVLALAIAFLVRRGITLPISRLAQNCDRLMLGKTIPAPKVQLNEISALELTFCKMSMVAAINEEARKSYLQHLKEVQAAALDSMRRRIDKLSCAPSLKSTARSQFENMRRAIDAMLQLLQQMTDELSFNTSAATVVNPTKTSTTEIYSASMSDLEWMAKRKHIELIVEDPYCELFVDRDLMIRVLNNLLSNAIKFSTSSSTVKLAGAVTGSELRTEVDDCGPGIGDQDRNSLFQKFKQLAAEGGQDNKGSGLGLLIARSIVEAHGGQIGCDSVLGKGSCFWFTLPLAMDSTGNAQKQQTNQAQPANQREKDHRPRTTIAVWFIGLFVVFLSGQVVFALQLNERFVEAASKARQFAAEQKNILDTEGLLYTFLNWRQKAGDAVQSSNHQALFESGSLLERQVLQSAQLEERFKQDAKLHEMIGTVRLRVEELDRGLNELIDTFGEKGNDSSIGVQLQKADRSAAEVESLLFNSLKLQASRVDSSYDLAVKLRREINEALALTAIFNFAVLAITTALGFRIVDRISRMNDKAIEFASGGTPRTTIGGNHELSFLDRRLCAVVEELRVAEEQRRNLLATINHDLRTPLTSIMHGLEMVSEGLMGEIQEEDFDAVIALQNDAEKLLEQISDLLAIEKAEADAIECHRAPVKVIPFLERVVESMRIKWKKKGVRIDVFADRLPGGTEVIVDPDLAERALRSLIQNSIEASKPGSTVAVRLAPDEPGVEVSIEDHGVGLDSQLKEVLFERFRSVNGKALVGLGLPLARAYCNLFGGSLKLVRSDGSGTVIAVLLPSVD